jgi:hypothetical protein
MKTWRKVFPDLHGEQFVAFASENGCAWRFIFVGHKRDATYHKQYEMNFIWTDDGRMTRWKSPPGGTHSRSIERPKGDSLSEDPYVLQE